jgi:hypothetical protein
MHAHRTQHALRALLTAAALATLAVLAPAALAPPAHAATTTSATVTGLDLHDGSVTQVGGTLFMYGTRYGCGFYWERKSPWCGYGVSTATSPAGPWSTPRLLFSPAARIKASWAGDNGKTWSAMCGGDGEGCFNPRMLHTPNGRWLLWFNAPGDKSRHTNPYWVMTCSGPAGPCGSPHKPLMYAACAKGGDFTVTTFNGQGWIICSGHEHELMTEALAAGMTNGAPRSAAVPGTDGESPGVWRTAAGYEMTMADPGCGYCSGTKSAAPGPVAADLSYATAPAMSGPWTYHGTGAGPCTGEPRSAFAYDGAQWEWVDMWNGTPREANAGVLFEPLSQSPWSCSAPTP